MFLNDLERPGLIEPKKVEDIQEVYTSTLQAYIDVHRPKHRTVFARLLMKLTDLRTLGSEHADLLFPHQSKPLPPPLTDHRGEQNFSNGTPNSGGVNSYTNERYGTAQTTLKYDSNSHLTTSYWGGPHCYPHPSESQNGSTDISGSAGFLNGQPGNYRVPNVRIKVEPISGEEGESRKKPGVNPTSPMLGDLLEKAVVSTFPEFKMEH